LWKWGFCRSGCPLPRQIFAYDNILVIFREFRLFMIHCLATNHKSPDPSIFISYWIYVGEGTPRPTEIYSPKYNCLGLAIFEVSSFLNSIHWVIHPTVLPITKTGVNIVFGIFSAVKMMPV